jgi:hypothetical protein
MKDVISEYRDDLEALAEREDLRSSQYAKAILEAAEEA